MAIWTPSLFYFFRQVPSTGLARLSTFVGLFLFAQPKKLKAAFPHCEVQNRSLSNFFMNRSEVSFARSRACSSAAEPNQFL
jgi:hypothetical protein